MAKLCEHFHNVVKFYRISPEMTAHGGRQTPQVPPKPIVTAPSSTITGTARRPLVNVNIRARSAGRFLTLMYSNATCRRW
jgi:hypothetical protein